MKTVLISVTDKTGLKKFAKGLLALFPSLRIITSGGTAKVLAESDIPHTAIQDVTHFPECFNGRVKTLHPKIMGGILYRRGIDDQMAEELDIEPIDMVVCNLYNFQLALPMDELIEKIDIGGSTLIRGACKNHEAVTVVVDPNDYDAILTELSSGSISLKTKQRLAIKGMNLSADYDSMIAEELSRRLGDEETRRPRLTQGRKLRYGENPDQEAWVYNFPNQQGIAQAEILSGKELSYNNYDDATVALNAADALSSLGFTHAVAIIKHGNLCAYATGKDLDEAFNAAWEGDSKSSFGGIIAFTSTVCESIIPALKNKFVEVLIAPEFTPGFTEWAKTSRPNLRLLQLPKRSKAQWIYKQISGGLLAQTPKTVRNDFKVVTKEQPTNEHKELFSFAIAAVQFGKSNAIAIVRKKTSTCLQLIGMGSGQPNRVDSLERLAIPKAIENLKKENAEPATALAQCVLASDGFFPFDDSIRAAAAAGIKTCIQPGGSNNDPTVIQTADELNMCMIFTGERYFCH